MREAVWAWWSFHRSMFLDWMRWTLCSSLEHFHITGPNQAFYHVVQTHGGHNEHRLDLGLAHPGFLRDEGTPKCAIWHSFFISGSYQKLITCDDHWTVPLNTWTTVWVQEFGLMHHTFVGGDVDVLLAWASLLTSSRSSKNALCQIDWHFDKQSSPKADYHGRSFHCGLDKFHTKLVDNSFLHQELHCSSYWRQKWVSWKCLSLLYRWLEMTNWLCMYK